MRLWRLRCRWGGSGTFVAEHECGFKILVSQGTKAQRGRTHHSSFLFSCPFVCFVVNLLAFSSKEGGRSGSEPIEQRSGGSLTRGYLIMRCMNTTSSH